MGGVLKLGPHKAWVPARWVFDGVLEDVARELDDQHPDLARSIRDAKADRGVGFLDAAHWSRASLEALLAAVARVERRTSANGPGAFHDPRGFPGYMSKIAELVKLLRDHLTSG